MARPLGLSNNVYPRLQPHIHYWTNLYGNSVLSFWLSDFTSIKIFFLYTLNFVFHTIGKNYLQWIGPQPEMIITEPELIKEILNNRERIYPKVKAHAYIKKVLGDGVATSEGEKWAKMRKITSYAFQTEGLKVSS